jgi:hypothetical protein
MSYWETLSPHTQSLLKWFAHNEAKRNAPRSTGAAIWPGLRSENRGAHVGQAKPNSSIASTIYPHLPQERK